MPPNAKQEPGGDREDRPVGGVSAGGPELPLGLRQRPDATKGVGEVQQMMARKIESQGVPFYPPSDKYWRIGGKWYDFEKFLDKHPGGSELLLLSRDRFEDATYVFEAHHHDYARVRRIIAKYEVPTDVALATAKQRPNNPKVPGTATQSAEVLPKLLGDDAFYSVMRRRVEKYLKDKGCRAGGPNTACLALWWTVVAGWAAGWVWLYTSGSFCAAVFLGWMMTLMGAFGHNWIHQPKYRSWANLSLDCVGFSSDEWYRSHLLQHHMYTNTPWDNHFCGTDPFLITDPTIPRNFLQRNLLPFMNPLLLTFGVPANYIAHTVCLLKGEEKFSPFKLVLPTYVVMMVQAWGWWGLFLSYTWMAIIGLYYFTMALMNHNSAHCHDAPSRNKARDWGEAQLHSSADWGVNMSFLSAGIYLWLNYHTVHHLFPRTDFCHHPGIQQIIFQTCKEFNIEYVAGDLCTLYGEMITSFRTPRSLYSEILVYTGNV